MAPNLHINNEDFEVGEISLQHGDASPHALPMPQFLYDGVGDECFPVASEEVSNDCFPAAFREVSPALRDVLAECREAANDVETFDENMRSRPARSDRKSPNPWPPKLTIDLALGIDSLEDILTSHGLDQAQYDKLITVPSFRRELAVTMRELRENGVPFARKAAIQAESYLLNIDDMVHDMEIPASTRLEAIKSVVKWGKLEPKDEKVDGNQNGTTVNLQINFT